MAIFESTLSTKVFGHKLNLDILAGLGRVIPYILGLYLLLKIVDLMVAGELGLAFSWSPYSLLWWAEIIIGVILPILLFSLPNVRQSRKLLFWTAILVIIGLIINRFNVSLLALEPRPGTSYFPHWMEFAISAGLIADALLIFMAANRVLPIMHHETTAQSVLKVSKVLERA
jgi:Ni/Fe-hydrogenase subunit HybB-like protein